MSIPLESLAGHLVLSKTFTWHLVNVKKSLKFDSIQHIHDHIWFMLNDFDKTKYQGPFGMDKMSYGCFGQDQTSANHRKSFNSHSRL